MKLIFMMEVCYMKIAISSMGKGINSMLDVRFGRCNYFVIYDTEDKFSKSN